MNTIVVAPHPDDEVLGVGGTILKRKSEGNKLAWLIVTGIDSQSGWDSEKVKQRVNEIKEISKLLQFDEVFELNFPAAKVDLVPMFELVSSISKVFKAFSPEEVFVPHFSDVHGDHRIVFDAVASCVKWFRHPSIRRVLAYETLSETNFGLGSSNAFCPNVYINIESFFDGKLEAMNTYNSEMDAHPFPRSIDAIRALATLRGASSGYKFAEAFELLMDREW